ncbi:hypothetical protein AAMO2058_001130700 [Amorphochlora amoebiformis]
MNPKLSFAEAREIHSSLHSKKTKFVTCRGVVYPIINEKNGTRKILLPGAIFYTQCINSHGRSATRVKNGEKLTWFSAPNCPKQRRGLITDAGIEKECRGIIKDQKNTNDSKKSKLLSDKTETLVYEDVVQEKGKIKTVARPKRAETRSLKAEENHIDNTHSYNEQDDNCGQTVTLEITPDAKERKTSEPPTSKTNIVWFWQKDDGTWGPYSMLNNAIMEQAKQDGEDTCQIGIAGMRYVVDFTAMEQVNPIYKTRRKLRRKSPPREGRSQKRKKSKRAEVSPLSKRKKKRILPTGKIQEKLKKLAKWEITRDSLMIKRRLGGGAYGEVHLAEWKGKGPVAVKSLYKSDKLALQSFIKEANMITKLRHRNIIKVCGLCTQSPPYAFVFEFAPSTLGNVLSKRKLGIGEMLQICDDIIAGLLYLHSRQPPVIHRDLKPENILLGCDGRAMLADFGISREQKATTLMTACGTPSYMPPEVLLDETYTTKVDIFAFAMIIYAMITGHSPWAQPQQKNPENSKKSKKSVSDGEKNGSVKPLSQFAIMKKVTGGARPPIPPNPGMGKTWNKLKDIMETCWRHDPVLRPGLKLIAKQIKEIKKEEKSIGTLLEMGFPRTESEEALDNADGNLEQATTLLLEN